MRVISLVHLPLLMTLGITHNYKKAFRGSFFPPLKMGIGGSFILGVVSRKIPLKSPMLKAMDFTNGL